MSEGIEPSELESNPISIPLTQYQRFCKVWPLVKHQRYGQAFHDHAQLFKLTSPQAKAWASELYNADNATAKKMIESCLDRNN